MNAAEISITMRVATTKTAATEAPDRFWALVKNLREHGTVPDHMEILLKGDPILAEAKDQYRWELEYDANNHRYEQEMEMRGDESG